MDMREEVLDNTFIQRWNFVKHKYEPHTPNHELVIYTEDMDLEIKCTNCEKDMVFGDAYTSKQYHNRIGIGYPVCEQCYEVEVMQDRKEREEREKELDA